MRVVTVQYRVIKFLPFWLSVTRLAPDRWSDLDGKQLDAFESLAANRIDGYKFLSVMLNLPAPLVRRFSDFEIYNLMEIMDFMSGTEGYLKRSAALGRTASVKPDELHSPLHYVVKQIEKEQKNE